MVRMDRVKRSSVGIVGKLMLENDLAADRSARKEAVKLDLKANLRGLKVCSTGYEDEVDSSSGEGSSSSSSKSMPSTPARGCSSVASGGERTGSNDLRMGLWRRLADDVLTRLSPGVSMEEPKSVANDSPPREGTESAEMVLASSEPMLLSVALRSSSAKSSGGDRSRSKGPRQSDDEPTSLPESCWSLMTSSAERLRSARRRLLWGRGMSVMARRAATEGEMASSEPTCFGCRRWLRCTFSFFM